MKKPHSSIVSALMLFSAAPALAEVSDLPSLFHDLEGHWVGRGSLTQLDAQGFPASFGFDVRMSMARAGFSGPGTPDTWAATTSTRLDSGYTNEDRSELTIRGELLFVGSYGSYEPVRVIESSPLSLTYQVRRAEALTGRVFDFTIHNHVDASGHELAGGNRAELNGVTVSESSFTARRW